MSKRKFRKRNNLDIILTDSRPVELPKNYSLVYFYNYLNSNPEMTLLLERVKRESRASDAEADLWGSRWHAVPLKYHIYKNRFDMRELSLLSPVSMIELPLFIEAFEKQLLLLAAGEGFSIRRHMLNDGLEYLDVVSGNGIKYRYSAEKSIESSGNYYLIKPYKFIAEFQNSSKWYELNRDYRCFGKIDYNKCFDSVYTHTFTWLVTKNSVDGKEYGKYQYFLNMCDKLLQNINGSVTNGIVVGPEFSRLMVEILAQHIDKCVKSRLLKEEIRYHKDYSVCRYVDDIFIFADEEKTIEHIIYLYREEAEKYHFHLNDQKCLEGKLPYAWFGWKEKVHSVNEYMCKTLFTDMNNSKYVIKHSPQMLPHMKMLHQNLIAEFPDYHAKITSYILTTMYKRVCYADKPFFSDDRIEKKLYYFLDTVFYFYAFSLSYNNTEKVISILNIVGNQIPEEIFRDGLRNVLSEYSLSIAKANPEDVINLILLVSMYEIELPNYIETMLIKKISESNNPIMYAVFLKYFFYNEKKLSAFKKVIEKRIESAISNIYREEYFFMYTEVWWIIIFANCHFLSNGIRDMIRNKLKSQEDFLESKTSVSHIAKSAKLLVVRFLLDNNIQYKFINWDMKKEELFDYTVFTTYQRTLFNGYNARMKDEEYDY